MEPSVNTLTLQKANEATLAKTRHFCGHKRHKRRAPRNFLTICKLLGGYLQRKV